MRILGFSSGALAPSDPLRAIRESAAMGLQAIELSALRINELEAIEKALDDPLLERFSYVSVHAPSSIPEGLESTIAKRLLAVSRGKIPVVVHPDVIKTPEIWEQLGSRLLLENMDRRKELGRFAADFLGLFEVLPEAGFCLDVAHVRQIDTTLTEGYKFIRMFSDRLREIHISEVTTSSSHTQISLHAWSHLRDFLFNLPRDVPMIIESASGSRSPTSEVGAVKSLLGDAPATTTW